MNGFEVDPEAVKARYREERAKRIRSDGNSQYLEVAGELARFANDPYATETVREPIEDHVDVLLIGGGIANLLLGARLKEAGFTDIRVVEKAGDVGGTWYWNRYPGAACDIESYIYLPLLEELGYMPSRKYVFAPEILAHLRSVARHFGLYDKACFHTSVTGVEWDDNWSHWVVTTDRGDRMTARVIGMALGFLSRPKLPGIEGLGKFEGHMFHTSRWDYGYTGGTNEGGLTGLRDKRVGIIGTGATAIQCIPHLAESARHLYVFQRTPAAVSERGNVPTDPEWFRALTPGWQQRRMENFNSLVSGGDEDEDLVGDGWTQMYRELTGLAADREGRRRGHPLTREERSAMQEMADLRTMERIRRRVDEVIEDPERAAAMKPWYKYFCKRPTFHDDYLSTFNRPNVTLVDTNGRGVDRITPSGAVVGDVEYELDCLIFATGFEVRTSYTRRAEFDIKGRNGALLSQSWADGLRTFHGMHAHGFPNCFFMGLTQTGATVNYSHTCDEQARHVAHVLSAVRDRGGRVVEATAEAEEWWVGEINRLARLGTAYFAECTPGFLNNEGNAEDPRGLYGDSYGAGPVAFFDVLRRWREEGQLDGLDIE